MAEASGTELAVTENNSGLPVNMDDDMVGSHESAGSSDSGNSKTKLKKNLGFGGDVTRQVIVIGLLSVCFALIVLLFAWVQEPDMRPLGKYETQELISVLDYLDQNKVDYKVDGNVVRVVADDYEKIKLKMLRAGVSVATNRNSAAGDDILLKDMGFGVSQQMERERLKLSRERQIAEAIKKMGQISEAQVMLALPKQSVFVRYSQPVSATVFLTLGNGVIGLSQEKVDAIVDLVATAVPGLKPTKITVTDQGGHLLSSGTQDPLTTAHRKEYELERKQEQALREKIDSILIPIIGFNNYTAQVDITLDFSTNEQTIKTFDPNNTPVRSEYIIEDNENKSVAQGVPGALSNQPPKNSVIPEDVKQLETDENGNSIKVTPVHLEKTRNFEIDTKIAHKRYQVGTIDRQTVSVAVNYRTIVDAATGVKTTVPVSDAELNKIRSLLMGAVGYSKNRGDLLSVVSVPFAPTLEIETIEESVPIWEHPMFGTWIRWGSAAIIIAVIVIVLVRPAMMNLLYSGAEPVQLEQIGEDGLPLGLIDDDIDLIGSDIDDTAGGGFSAQNMLPDLHKEEDLLRAVRALVSNEPDLAAQVIRSWVTKK